VCVNLFVRIKLQFQTSSGFILEPSSDDTEASPEKTQLGYAQVAEHHPPKFASTKPTRSKQLS
jgi:hypothetical protein